MSTENQKPVAPGTTKVDPRDAAGAAAEPGRRQADADKPADQQK